MSLNNCFIFNGEGPAGFIGGLKRTVRVRGVFVLRAVAGTAEGRG